MGMYLIAATNKGGHIMEAVAKLRQEKTLKPGEAIIEYWGDTAFLIEGRDRHGRRAYSLRLVIGDDAPWRFGPFSTKSEADKEFNRLIDVIRKAVGDVPGEMSGDIVPAQEW